MKIQSFIHLFPPQENMADSHKFLTTSSIPIVNEFLQSKLKVSKTHHLCFRIQILFSISKCLCAFDVWYFYTFFRQAFIAETTILLLLFMLALSAFESPRMIKTLLLNQHWWPFCGSVRRPRLDRPACGL